MNNDLKKRFKNYKRDYCIHGDTCRDKISCCKCNIGYNDGGWMLIDKPSKICDVCKKKKSYFQYDTYIIDSGGYDFPWRTVKEICLDCENDAKARYFKLRDEINDKCDKCAVKKMKEEMRDLYRNF